MGSPVDTIKTAILGSPLNPSHRPSQTGVIRAFTEMQTQLEGAQAGAIVKASVAALQATTFAPASAMAWVTNDPTPYNNAIYENVGQQNAPVWHRRIAIPQFLVTAIYTGGTTNAIQASSDLPIPTEDGRAMIAVNIVTDNTGPMTVSFNGGPNLEILTNSGNPLQAGYAKTGMFLFGFISDNGTKYRLFSEQVPESILAAAEAAAQQAINAASSVNIRVMFTASALANLSVNSAVKPLYDGSGWSLAEWSFLADRGAIDVVQGIIIRSTVDPTLCWVRDEYLNDKPVQVLWFKPDISGNTSSVQAFSIAAQLAKAVDTSGALYTNMPHAPTANVHVSQMRLFLDDWVNTGGKHINWILEDTVIFNTDCARLLNGKTVRSSRVNYPEPHSSLDHAAAFAILAGLYEGNNIRADQQAGVSGWLHPDDIGGSTDIGDIVALYTEVNGIPPLYYGPCTYNGANQVVIPIASLETRRLRRGMYLATDHNPILKTILLSWSVVGSDVVLETTGWRVAGQVNTGQADTIPPDNIAYVTVNAVRKVWTTNFNLLMNEASASGGTRQGVLCEAGVFPTPSNVSTNFNDFGKYTWGFDLASLSGHKVTVSYVSRGVSYLGYLAAGNDVGFRSSAFIGQYAAPAIGFIHEGDGTAFSALNGSGQSYFSVTENSIEFGRQGGTDHNVVFDFHTNGAVVSDYDFRILSTTGAGGVGSGYLFLQGQALFTHAIMPELDNQYALGAQNNRYSQLYAATGTINTSDPKLKKFINDDEQMQKLQRAVLNLKIQPFQWLDAIKEKGEDGARIHIGVNAEHVISTFAAEGLDAHRYGLFCEDDEYEQYEIIENIEIPEFEYIDEEKITYVKNGDAIKAIKSIEKTRRPKTFKALPYDEDGTPILSETALTNEDGEPIRRMTKDGPVIVRTMKHQEITIPITTTRVVKRMENRPTGNKRYALRYDQLAMLMITALQSLAKRKKR